MKTAMRAILAALLVAALGGPAAADVYDNLQLNLAVNNLASPGAAYGTISGPLTYDATMDQVSTWNLTFTPANGSPIAAFAWTPGNSSFKIGLLSSELILYTNPSGSGPTANLNANANASAGSTPTRATYLAASFNTFFFSPPPYSTSTNAYISGTLAPALTQSVPEPSPLALAGLGSLAVLALARRHRPR